MTASGAGSAAAPGDDRAYLRERDFILTCIARFSVTLGSQAKFVAIGWYIYDLTQDPYALGIVGLATFLPAIAFTLVIGLVVDRFDRRLVLAICSAGMAVAAAGQFLNIWTGTHSPLVVYLVLIVYGTGRAFFQPATAALLPNIVRPEHFTKSVSFAAMVGQTATISGPAFGGFLYWLHPLLPFAVALAFYCVSIVCHLVMKPRPHQPRKDAGPAWPQLIAGFTFMWGKPVVFGAIVLDMVAVVLGGAFGLLPLFARDILHVGPEGLGLLRSAPAVGGLMISAILARHTFVDRNSGQILLIAVAVFGLATMLFGLSSSFLLSLLCLVVIGAADTVSVVIRLTLVQAETPDELRGRVSSVNSLFTAFSNEIGQFRAGVMAGLIGAVPAVVIGGIGSIALAWAWARYFPDLARRDHLMPPSAPKS